MPYTTCEKCKHYSHAPRRCKLGHANPRTKKGTKEAMRFMGTAYICRYSKWKDTVVDELIAEKRSQKEK